MEKLFKQKQVFLQIPANDNYANVFKDKYNVREIDDTIYLKEKQDDCVEELIDVVEDLIDLIDGQEDDFLTEEEKEYDKPAFQRNKKPNKK